MRLQRSKIKQDWKLHARVVSARRVKPLLPNLPAPAAIAFSGGGDSTPMLHAARNNPNITHALIVDHALRAGSAEEAERAANIAGSYGYQVRIDRWGHNGITAGIQAKARAYRYEALGRMCRAAGIKHLLTAHTEDDQAETLLMRLDRQTGWRGLAAMPANAYAPLWPALAGVTLHRPWLDVSRRELRDYNAQHGLSFVDDPSNQNTDFARIRARQALAADPDLRADLLRQQIKMRQRLIDERRAHGAWLSAHAKLSLHNYIETDAAPPPELLLHILNSVSGRGGPIDAAKRARLCRDMESMDFTSATLGGAWIVRKNISKKKDENLGFMFLRDRVAVTGRDETSRLQRLALGRHVETLWDGRFSCFAKTDGIHVELAAGNLQKLRQLPEFKALFNLPKEVRESLPVFFLGEQPVGFGACDTKYLRSEASSASRLQALYLDSHLVTI